MAYRRSGGMGGGPRAGRSFSQHQPFEGSGVSPWQGSSNSNQGLLSDSQQLAMALSSLLQPQQNNPPSLLSLNTPPAFSSPNRSFDRFGKRGRDMRRHEPYSKSGGGGGGWRRDRRNAKKGPASKDKNKNDDKKKEDKEKVIDLSEDGNENKEGEENEGKKELKEGPYIGVPAKYLHCFICGKEMWDGESMEKHVRGRAHRQMLDSLEESIHLTVNILREHMRLAEEKKVIEKNRMKRGSKFNRRHEPESYCNMCELKFMGKIVAHRKTEGHQRLKRYLHPNCEVCDMEFPSRIGWVEHRLTPDHLKKLHESLEKKEQEEDSSPAVAATVDEGEPDLEPILDESLQMEAELPVFELTDDLTGLQNLIPAYKPDRAVSKQSLSPFSGFRCQLCNRSYENEELAQEHLKTRRHYYAFVEAAKAKYKEIQAQKEREEKAAKKALEKAQEKAQANGDAEMYDPEEACNENGKDAMDTTEGDQAQNNTETELQDDNVKVEEEEEEEVEAEAAEVIEIEDEEKVAEKPAEKKPAANSTPARPLRTAAAAAAANGVGPKSKKARK